MYGKCFNCNEIDHAAAECPKKNAVPAMAVGFFNSAFFPGPPPMPAALSHLNM
jgi:hypothetical protein